LDAFTGRDVARSGAETAAATILEELDELPGPRDWWRLAYAGAGQLVGIAVPSRNFQHPVVGFVGVLPEHRGHGYARDLLGHATRFLAGQGAERILADTDTKNRPMAAAFDAAGYRNTSVRIVLEAAAPSTEGAR
jgi:GNAT superfamily N-acetyltransferase